jgi:hypothetical protein
VGRCRLESSGSGQGPVAGSSEHGNELPSLNTYLCSPVSDGQKISEQLQETPVLGSKPEISMETTRKIFHDNEDLEKHRR